MKAEQEVEIKLPLVGKSLVLETLPGQDPALRYGVVWDVCQQPGDGLGYVVRYTDAHACRILAWMGKEGIVTECERPLAFVMPGIPALAVLHRDGEEGRGVVRARRHGSDELVEMAGFRDVFPNQVAFTPLAGKGVEGAASDEELAGAIGPYAGRKLGWRTFVAVSYLAFYLIPRIGSRRAHATGSIADVLATFTETPLPDAVDSLIFRVMAAGADADDDVSGFERYAARMLDQAGAAQLRGIAARRAVGVTRLSTTHLFWMRFGDDVEPQERQALLAVEACLNRLALVEAALKAQGISTKLADCREGVCALEDQRALARVADGARALFDGSREDNPYCTYLPASPARGGEWDMRTRFIRACERTPAPFRLEYRFDCDAAGGMLHAVFALPPVESFPGSRWNASASRWENRGDERAAFAACYAVRLSALVAACGFGAGLGVRQVVVEGRARGVAGEPLLSARFERMSFLNRTLSRIDAGMVARMGEHGPCAAEDVRALVDLLAPMEVRIGLDPDGGLSRIDPIAVEFPPSRLPLSADDRVLPAPIAHLLHADCARDLDVEGGNDLRMLDAVQTAVEDAKDSPLLAMARLEEIAANSPVPGLEPADDVVAAAEAALRGGSPRPGYELVDDAGESRPVRVAYFSSPFARCLVDVVADREDERFEALPSHAYLARAALAKLYLADGDEEAALARIAECVALAPTSEGSLLEAAQLYLAAQHLDEAIDLLKQALRICVRRPMANILYAHLAGAFWGSGEQAQALSCFVMAQRDGWGLGGADQAMSQLARQLGLEGVPAAPEAEALLRAYGVPIAPTNEVRTTVIASAVGLTDARMFELAWPLVGVIGMDVGNDVISYLGEMLHAGIPEPAHG